MSIGPCLPKNVLNSQEESGFKLGIKGTGGWKES